MKIETKAIHSGVKCDPTHGSVVTPIHQTAGYQFDSAETAANRFSLDDFGPSYSRMGNPTCDQFEARMTALEGGIGAMSVASGMTAVAYAVMNICKSGDNFVTSRNLYGGVFNLFDNILRDYGIEARFVEDHNDAESFRALADDKTRLFFGETLPNPRLNIFPIDKVAEIANEMDIPLFIDNTCATPAICKPFEHGAHVVIHSATKYIGGHGNSIGGIVIDSGKFDWENSARHPMLSEPDSSMHDVVWAKKYKELSFLVKLRTTMLRDFGGCLAPMNAFLFNQGIETLPLRMERHCENAAKVADFLKNHPKVVDVRYPGLTDAKNHADRLFTKGMYGPMVGVELKGGSAAGKAFVDNSELFYHVANIGDVRSMAIHPASTTHSQISPEDRAKAGIPEGYVRLCIGIENIDDLLEDLSTTLDKIVITEAA